MKTNIIHRDIPTDHALDARLHPVLARIYAARGVHCGAELDYSLDKLLPYQALKNIGAAADLLARALRGDQRILIVADFDADGATSCAVAMRCLRAMGARQVDYIVPNRFEFGYGLTPEIVDVARHKSPDLIITVDNGISSIAGVKHARALGIDVLVTDHHLPGAELPEANVIVNPNQPGDEYPGKYLSGVGVIFNIMIALRALLREQDWFVERNIDDVNLARVLDLVALGTVADVVPLEYNNRVMVSQGLARIRARHCCPGILALLEVGQRAPERITAADLGFVVGPRLNAAGRLTDMSLGIECLLSDDHERAAAIARQLHDLNSERREIQQQMEVEALETLEAIPLEDDGNLPAGICLYDPGWHQGVVGVLASRIREKTHRPVIIFAPDRDGWIKGSGRSIDGVHIRDVLESIASRHPQLISKFGGHAMAAGLTLPESGLDQFRRLFDATIQRQTGERPLHGTLLTDGELAPADMNMALARAIRDGGPWGQGFPEPQFLGDFRLQDARIVGGKHLKTLFTLADGTSIDAIAFNTTGAGWLRENIEVRTVYRLDINEFRGRQTLQLVLEAIEPLHT